MNSFSNMFNIDNNTPNLGVTKKNNGEKKPNMTDEILQIFTEAEKIGKTQLTLDEITIAYYNMFTKKHNEKTGSQDFKNKKDIALKLFYMRKIKNADKIVDLVPRQRGLYYLKKLG